MTNSMNGRFLEVSLREKILDLRREELLLKEQELDTRQTVLEAKEKVLGSRAEQIFAREKQFGLKENILNLQNEEMEDVKNVKLLEAVAAPMLEESEDSRMKNTKGGEIDGEKQINLLNEMDEPDPASWTALEETILIHLMVKEVHKGNKPKTTFSYKGWKNIEHGFYEKTKKSYTRAQFKNKFSSLRLRYCNFSNLLKQPGFNWDPMRSNLTATDDVWESHIKVNKVARRFQKRGCPLYNELGIIYGDPAEKHENTSKLSQYSLDPEAKFGLEDESTIATRFASGSDVSDRDDPLQSIRHRSPSPVNRIEGKMNSRSIIADMPLKRSVGAAFPPRLFDEKCAEVAHTQAPITNHNGEISQSCSFSITNCVECLEAIQGIDANIYVKALKMFKDADWREMFMAMSAERRLDWLCSLE